MAKFDKIKKQNFEKLKLFVPVVERVHGGSHPEFYDVRKLFDKINEKIEGGASEKPALDDEFKKLREITGDYTVPEDVCESYEAVYNMLSELDEAYRA